MPRTAVLVTHDIEEAAQLADRIVVLTQRPARIRHEFTISTPRPREPTNPEVVDAVRRILAELNVESGAGQH
jgi:NitT/TauT family transport system ATP-binding protein